MTKRNTLNMVRLDVAQMATAFPTLIISKTTALLEQRRPLSILVFVGCEVVVVAFEES